MKEITVNKIPSPTWSWLKMDKVSAKFNDNFTESSFKLENDVQDGLSVSTKKYEKSAMPEKTTDADEDFFLVLSDFCKNETVFSVNKSLSKPVIINLPYANKENSLSVHKIVAEENTESTFIFLYSSNPEDEGNSLIHTEVTAKENASVKIVKAQLLGEKFVQLDNTTYSAADNASVNLTLIELGSQEVYSSVHTNLSGYKSNFYSETAYFCQKNQKFDFNHVCFQTGKKTDCKMYVNGTLKDDSKKTYRGTIDFKNGCAGSTGDEQEQVLVLSPKAVNNSIPVILCDEEDVAGEHGASIGRLSDEVLFYMRSRGISKEEAENIMARAKISAVTSKINDEKTNSQITAFINRIFGEE